MERKWWGRLALAVLVLIVATTPVLAGSGPGPLPEPPGGGGKPSDDEETEFEWWPGDPAWLECERAGGGDFPYAVRIGTGSAKDPYGLTRVVYGNTINVTEVWSQKRTGTIAFNWASNPDPIGIVIVKSGRAANVYRYPEPTYSDTGLVGVGQWDPSHLTFCWGPGGDEPPVCEWVGETAWGAGDRYVEQGNWATYTAYETGMNILIFAGQGMEAGYLTFSEVSAGKVTITITLFSGWRFEAVEENVKIQPYDTVPLPENPAPGRFAVKATAETSPFTIEVDAAAYYGIHLNLEWEDCH